MIVAWLRTRKRIYPVCVILYAWAYDINDFVKGLHDQVSRLFALQRLSLASADIATSISMITSLPMSLFKIYNHTANSLTPGHLFASDL